VTGPAEQQPGRPAAPAGARFSWFLGVIIVALIAYVTLNTIRTDAPGSRGIPAGGLLPPFAAPLVASTLDGDANVATKRGQGSAGPVPACTVRDPRALNLCRLAARGPLVLTFVTVRDGHMARQLDAMEAIRRRSPGIGFAAVVVRGDRGEARRLVAEHRWGFPVAWDRDGAVSNRYAVAVTPTTTLAAPRRVAVGTLFGEQRQGELAGAVKRLEQASRKQGWSPPA
jgi:hypothetical protein